jgi:small subunit ribosomal protein S6
MNKYEFTFLLPDEKEVENIKQLLESLEGKVVEEQKWGKKLLVYPINKQTSAHFTTWQIEMKPSKLTEFKKKLNFNETLLRYLLLKVE